MANDLMELVEDMLFKMAVDAMIERVNRVLELCSHTVDDEATDSAVKEFAQKVVDILDAQDKRDADALLSDS